MFILGRDSSNRCIACKRVAMRDAYDRRVSEERAADAAIREAEHRRERAAHELPQERAYQAALAAGGEIAANARWKRQFDESRHGLCQWAFDESLLPGACFRRPDGSYVYCARHNRQLDREAAQRSSQIGG
jgi:hypothetical protein